jgi:putative ABC transport system substrate-binding protein
MRRREFIAGLGGAVAWPMGAQGQQSERVRRISVLLTFPPDDQETMAGLVAFRQALQQSGWTDGGNVRIDMRSSSGDADQIRQNVKEAVASAPDVIFAMGTANAGWLLQSSRTVPVVFAYTADPVGAGFVESLSRPGGNATGFIQFEYGLSVKWLELLKEIVPRVTRVAVLRDPAISAGIGQWGAIQSVAPTFGVEVSPVNVREAGEIERGIATFARSAGGGLILTGSALSAIHADLIIALASRHKLPAVYFLRRFVSQGGLISYGPDVIDQYRRAGSYVDRILRGEKPADLPVQAPTKYELAINLKTAKALSLDLPQPLLARADEVIE